MNNFQETDLCNPSLQKVQNLVSLALPVALKCQIKLFGHRNFAILEKFSNEILS